MILEMLRPKLPDEACFADTNSCLHAPVCRDLCNSAFFVLITIICFIAISAGYFGKLDVNNKMCATVASENYIGTCTQQHLLRK